VAERRVLEEEEPVGVGSETKTVGRWTVIVQKDDRRTRRR